MLFQRKEIIRAIFFGFMSSQVHCAINLEDRAQKFVLETKQIIIPKYPHAFNPSIIYWNNTLLMSFRIIPNPKQPYYSEIGLVFLDKNFLPIGEPQLLETRGEDSEVPSRAEDASLIMVGEHLYIVYDNNTDKVISKGGYRMHIAELYFDGKKFHTHDIECISYFEGNSKNRREKSWVPFDYSGELFFAYSLVPHLIFHSLRLTKSCQTYASSKSLITWDWGVLRGGTPGLLMGDHYLAFFHSSTRMTTTHSHNKDVMHYFMGAYTFSKKPPFAITRISSEPIIGKNFYTGPDYKPYWKPEQIKVVFCRGFIYENDYIWLAYGREDHEIWLAKLDKKGLYESLRPVSTIKSIY